MSDEEQNSTYVIWDNVDYMLEISGDLDKNSLLNLVKSAEIYQKTE